MNNMLANYMGFDGRLNRQKWWISAIILAVVGFIISWILGLIMGGGAPMSLTQALDPAVLQKAGWQSLILGIVLAYPYLAITIKRRHDRNNNGMDVVGFLAVELVYYLLMALGLTVGIVGTIVGLAFGVYAIYILVVVGFLKGTAGPNSFGPDPLQG